MTITQQTAFSPRRSLSAHPTSHVRFAATLEADKAQEIKTLLTDVTAGIQARQGKIGSAPYQVQYQGPLRSQPPLIGMFCFQNRLGGNPKKTVYLIIYNHQVPTTAFWGIRLDPATGKLATLPFSQPEPGKRQDRLPAAPAFEYLVKKEIKQKPPGKFAQWLNAQLERWCPGSPPEGFEQVDVIISPEPPEFKRKTLPLTPENQQRAYTMATDLLTRARAALTRGNQSNYAVYWGPGKKIS